MRYILYILLFISTTANGQHYPIPFGTGKVTAPSFPVDTTNLVLYADASNAASITHTASVVSQWNDLYVTGHNLTSTLTKRPLWNGTGVVFDGINDMMQAAFTLPQPVTVYMVCRINASIANQVFYDGVTNASINLQDGGLPFCFLNGLTGSPTSLGYGTNFVMQIVINSASVSSVSIGTNALTIMGGGGSAGGGSPNGFTVGARGGGAFSSSITVQYIAVYKAAHSSSTKSATQIAITASLKALCGC